MLLVHSSQTSPYIMILHSPETNSVQKNHNVTNVKEVNQGSKSKNNDWFTDDNSNNRISASEQNETERIKSSVNNLLISYQLWVISVASRKSKNFILFLIFYSAYSPNVSFHSLFVSFTRYRNVKRVLNFWLFCFEQIRSHAHMCINT